MEGNVENAELQDKLKDVAKAFEGAQGGGGMAGVLAALASSGLTDVNQEQVQKELMRHQAPLAPIIASMVEVLKYQKSLIPRHVIGPLINSVKERICSELDKI